MTYRISENYNKKMPPGYTYIIKSGTRFIGIDSQMAEPVKDAFILMASGVHTYDTIKKLIQGKYGVNLTRGIQRRMFNDEFYIGYVGEIQHIYKPLVNKETFDLAKENDKKRRKGRVGRVFRRSENRFVYSGIFKCDECLATCSAYIAKKRYIYYECNRTKFKHKAKSINQDSIDEHLSSLPNIYDLKFERDDIKKLNIFYRSLVVNGKIGKSGIHFTLNEKIPRKGINALFSGDFIKNEISIIERDLSQMEKFLLVPKHLDQIFKHFKDDESVNSQLIDLQLQDKIKETESGSWQTI